MKYFFDSKRSVLAVMLLGGALIGCEGPEAESIGRAPSDSDVPVAVGTVDSVADLPAMGPEAPTVDAAADPAAEEVLAPEGVVPDPDALAVAGPPPSAQEPSASESLASSGSTAGASVEDTLLTTQVKAALLADPEIRDDGIRVQADQGEITLSGSVENQAQLDAALQVARGVDGVRDVENNLKVGN